MTRKLATISFITVLAIGTIALAADQGHKWQIEPPATGNPDGAAVKPMATSVQVPDAPLSATAIQYDSGTVNATANTYGFVFGNRFDSNEGNPIDTAGQVTQVQFYLAALSGTGAWVSFFGAPVGTSAPVITAFSNPGMVIGMNTAPAGPFNISAIGTDFLAGALNFNTSLNPSGNAVGLDVGGTNMGQGFHGMMIHSTFTPTGYAALSGTNGVFRVLGTNLPVELQNFDIE